MKTESQIIQAHTQYFRDSTVNLWGKLDGLKYYLDKAAAKKQIHLSFGF